MHHKHNTGYRQKLSCATNPESSLLVLQMSNLTSQRQCEETRQETLKQFDLLGTGSLYNQIVRYNIFGTASLTHTYTYKHIYTHTNTHTHTFKRHRAREQNISLTRTIKFTGSVEIKTRRQSHLRFQLFDKSQLRYMQTIITRSFQVCSWITEIYKEPTYYTTS